MTPAVRPRGGPTRHCLRLILPLLAVTLLIGGLGGSTLLRLREGTHALGLSGQRLDAPMRYPWLKREGQPH